VNIHFEVLMTFSPNFLLQVSSNQGFCGPTSPISSRQIPDHETSLPDESFFVSKLSVRQLKQHVYDRSGIYGLSHAQRGLEPHLVGGPDGGFIQAVSQTANHAIHMQRPIGGEPYFKQNFTFQLQTASLIGVDRLRLEGDLHRDSGWPGIGLGELRSAMNHLLGAESAG
jgi:hypothetical protein